MFNKLLEYTKIVEVRKTFQKLKNLDIQTLIISLLIPVIWIILGLTVNRSLDIDLLEAITVLSGLVLGLTLYYWNSLSSPVGRTWKNILISGLFINGAAVLLVFLEAYTISLVQFSLIYWLAAPGYGFMVNANFLPYKKKKFALLAQASSILTIIYIVGFFQTWDTLVTISTLGIGLTQSIAVYTAFTNK